MPQRVPAGPPGHVASDQDFADCYSPALGRPSIRPLALAKVMLLQYRTGGSDRQAIEAVERDLRWRAALCLPVDHQGWDRSSLTGFRARLMLDGKERLVLENSLRLADQLGLLDAPAERIVDSTPMLGAAAIQDTVRLVGAGVRKLLDVVAAVDPAAGARPDGALEFDYQKPSDKPDCRWRQTPERERMLTQVAQDAERCLGRSRRPTGRWPTPASRTSTSCCASSSARTSTASQSESRALQRGTGAGRHPVHDPETRHRRKSSSQRFDGFKLHAAAA